MITAPTLVPATGDLRIRRTVAAIRRALLELVWHAQPDWQSIDTVTEHVYRLRQKLDRSGNGRRWIETVRGVGYRFRAGGGVDAGVPVAS
jgi:DNA-binding response OmpR family regulator